MEPPHSEVMPMDAPVRILAIRLMEALRKDPAYARSLGMEAGLKKRSDRSGTSALPAGGLTER